VFFLKVSELMTSDAISVMPDDTAGFAAALMARHNIGALPVCTPAGALRGIVTDRDITLRCISNDCDPYQTCVREIMSRNISSVSPDADIREAARIMADKKVRRLPVVNEGKIEGMLSLGDIAKSRSSDIEASKALSDISMPDGKHRI